jgi:hypothetical protein
MVLAALQNDGQIGSVVDVQSLRNYVRNHLEMDDEELPDVLLNVYLQDGFERTIARDNRWPRYEKTWSVSKVEGSPTATLPDDLLVPSIMSVTHGIQQLVYLTQENLESMFSQSAPPTVGTPVYYTVWGRELGLWPNPGIEAVFDMAVRGYRQPVWTNEASTIPDLDERLHLAVAYYAMALSYSQQEDEILEGVHMARWDRDVAATMRTIMDPPRHRPLVMNGGTGYLGGNSYVINPPVEPVP